MGKMVSADRLGHVSGALYALTHFWVDLSCIYLMLRFCAVPGYGAVCLLLYNGLAFAGQMPLGMIADSWNRNGIMAAAGCALIAAAVAAASVLSGGAGLSQASGAVLPESFAMAATAAAGLGNAMFHVGGGLEALNKSHENASALGIFVAPGAVGLFVGRRLISAAGFTWLAALGLLVLAAGLLAVCRRQYGPELRTGNTAVSYMTMAGWKPLVLLFVAAVVQSFAGLCQDYAWGGAGYLTAALVAAVTLGKICGGFLTKRLRPLGAAVLSLSLSAALYLGSANPVLLLGAAFLFNMMVTLILWMAARQMPGAKGLAYGTMKMAIFVGYLPFCVGCTSLPGGPAAYSAAAVLMLLLLAAASVKRTGVWRG